jgi:hypothetical protein
MTTYYVDSNGSNTSPYDTWAKAANKLATIAAIDATNDVILVAHNHSETTATSITEAIAGTSSASSQIICTNSGTNATSTGAIVALTGASSHLTLNGAFYCYGLIFNVGDSTNLGRIYINTTSPRKQTYEACEFKLLGTSSSSYMTINNAGGSPNHTVFKDCIFTFSNASQSIACFSGIVEFYNVGFAGTASTTVFSGSSLGQTVYVRDSDLSSLGTNALYFSNGGHGKTIFQNCKVAANYVLTSSTLSIGERVEAYKLDSGGTNYQMRIADGLGALASETTIVKSGGATDGTTPLSWKMSSNAACKFPGFYLESGEIHQWNETTGSSITVTVEIVHDTNVTAGQGAGTSYAFRDDEVWLEVEYSGSAATPIASLLTDRCATYSTTPADQASSSVTWTTTGLTTPVKQKLSVTFTPQLKGAIKAKVCMAKASKTIYIDPVITIT